MSDSSWWREYSVGTAAGLTVLTIATVATLLWPSARAFLFGAITIPAGAWLAALILIGVCAWHLFRRRPVAVETVAVELLSPANPPVLAKATKVPEVPEVSDAQLSVLKSLIRHEWVAKAYVANELHVGHQLAHFHIEELETLKLVYVSRDGYGGVEVQLSPQGRRFLAAKGLL